jgi:uncharacterized membrane protein
MIEKRRPQTKRPGAMTPTPKSQSDRYWRTVRRKLGESLDLAGKALMAAGTAATLAPLATKGEIRFPTVSITVVIVAGLVFLLAGIHLQAKVKPDE